MVEFQLFEFFGGLVFWAFSGFRGSFTDMKKKQYSAIVGFVTVTVLFIVLIYINDYFGLI